MISMNDILLSFPILPGVPAFRNVYPFMPVRTFMTGVVPIKRGIRVVTDLLDGPAPTVPASIPHLLTLFFLDPLAVLSFLPALFQR